MTDQRDEVLLGTESARARDTDGDGVSDAQERLDGTDPRNAQDFVAEPTREIDSNDPHAVFDEINLEREAVVDVLSGLPIAESLDQTLGKGLDGQPLGKSTNRYGNADAEGLLAEHGVDANSPLNIGRGVLAGSNPTTPASKGFQTAPPSDLELSFQAPNLSLVSDEADGGTPDPHAPPMTAEEKVKARDSNQENRERDKWKKENEGKTVNPDADTGGGVVTVDQVEGAIVLQGADTDFVPGAGIHIEGDAPLKRPIDLVTDGGDEDPGAGAGETGTFTPPGSEISKPVDPQGGLLSGGELRPNSGPRTGDGNPNTGRDGFSSAATATSNTDGLDSGSGVTNIGTESTGGIQSVASDDIGGITAQSEFGADIEVADDLAFGFADLLDDTFAQRSTEIDDLVPVDANPDEGF